jgi:hypothetical protein
MGIWLEFYGELYKHLDGLEYTPGIMMLYNALPANLQAHFLELNNEPEKLPDPSIFNYY